MGAQPSRTVSVLAPGEQPGPFSIRRHPEFVDQLQTPPEGWVTMQDFYTSIAKKYANNPYVGVRPFKDGAFEKRYVFKTYGECYKIADEFGRGLAYNNIVLRTMFGIYSDNCPMWVHAIDASSLYGFAIVSLYDSLGQDSLAYLINHSKMEGILLAPKNMAKVLNLLSENTYNVKLLVTMGDHIEESDKETAKNLGIALKTFDEVCAEGREHSMELPKISEDDTHFICYSSGTTGNPKGIIIHHKASLSNTLSAAYVIVMTTETRYISYLPLAHVFERAAHAVAQLGGARIGFTSGGVRTLSEDMGILKPTVFTAVPRVMNRFHDVISTKISNSSKISKGIFWACWYAKKFCLSRDLNTAPMDTIVFNKVKKNMGGEVEEFVVGGAALDPSVHEFMQVVTGVPVRSGYGLTEAGSGNIIQMKSVHDCIPGTVGGPLPNVEARLEPIEGYDDPECGELLIGGPCVSKGYLNDEAATQALFYNEERTWIKTGDVGKWLPNGHLKIVDRIRSIFKLSQGEYVAAEFVTQVYENAPIVKQIFVYGDSTRSVLVAIVVPKIEEILRFLGRDQSEKLTEEEIKALVEREDVNQEVMRQMNDEAKSRKLFGYQFVKAIKLEPTEWTEANGFLTPTFKMKRKTLADHYKQDIEALYMKLG